MLGVESPRLCNRARKAGIIDRAGDHIWPDQHGRGTLQAHLGSLHGRPPQDAIDVRGYADFAPLGHSVRVLREEEKATISWRLKFRDGREKNFVSPIRTTPWGSIKGPAEYSAPSADDFNTQNLAHEPDALNIEGGLPALRPDQLQVGVI